jgi:NTP pyrophosphatase (non-canonical NTP hydrolase)
MSREKAVPESEQELLVLAEKVRSFCAERNWDQFHDIKELAIGVVTESAELLEIFRFRSKEESENLLSDPGKRTAVEDELADVFFFILRIAGRYQIDLKKAFLAKLEKNALKYPIEKAYGSNRKYNDPL